MASPTLNFDGEIVNGKPPDPNIRVNCTMESSNMCDKIQTFCLLFFYRYIFDNNYWISCEIDPLRFLGIDEDKSYLNVVRYKFIMKFDPNFVEKSRDILTSFIDKFTKSLIILMKNDYYWLLKIDIESQTLYILVNWTIKCSDMMYFYPTWLLLTF